MLTILARTTTTSESISETLSSNSSIPLPRPHRQMRRAAVVGIGRQAVEDHIPGLASTESAELVAVCDSDSARLAPYESAGVSTYTSYERMLHTENLDFVIVTVPHNVGAAVIRAAAENGVHVLKEKPFATTLEEANELKRLCATAGIELMVTLQRRFNPIYTSFPQLADQIGTHFMIDAQYTLHTNDPSEGWRGHRSTAGGGCIIDMGYHIIDTLLWYFGLPNRILADTSVEARPDRNYDAEDSALIHFGYDSGLYGSLLLSRFIGPKAEHIRLIGSKGIVHLERGCIRRLGNDGKPAEVLTREHAWTSAAASQIEYFCRVIDGTRPNISGPTHNLGHMKFISACYASARTRTYIDPRGVQ